MSEEEQSNSPSLLPDELPYTQNFMTREEAEAFTWQGLKKWQEWLQVWHRRNFGSVPLSIRVAKLLEEAGELGSAVVRLWHCEQNNAAGSHVRRFEAELRDSVADVVVVATTIAIQYGWNLEDILKDVRTELSARKYDSTGTIHTLEEV